MLSLCVTFITIRKIIFLEYFNMIQLIILILKKFICLFNMRKWYALLRKYMNYSSPMLLIKLK